MKLIRTLLATAALAFALPAMAQTSTWKIDPAHSGLDFSIKHLGVSTVRGRIHNLTGDFIWDAAHPDKSRVTATADTATVNTDEPKRDEHLKSPDFFDAAKYPKITFKSTAVKVVSPGKLKVTGDLTLGGQTHSVTWDAEGPAEPQKNAQGKTVSGFSLVGALSRKTFNFGQKYSMPTLGDEVKFTIDVEMQQQ